jgi:hypothetical protein
MRSFTNLTRQYNITSVVLNSVIQNRASNPLKSKDEDEVIPTSTPWMQESKDIFHLSNHPSIFISNSVKPALGRSFSHYIDIHILLSRLPRRRLDARLVYAGTGVGPPRNDIPPQAEMVNVAEVIIDRWDGRIGRWCGFTIDDGIVLNTVRL